MRGLRSAIGFLTILPVAAKSPDGNLPRAPTWFPVVGLILGLIVAFVDGFLRLGRLILRTRSAPDAGDLRSWFRGDLVVPFEMDLGRFGESAGIHGLIEFRETPALLEGVVLVAVLALLTRGLHLDGFMDTFDALSGGRDRERRMEILKDPRMGAFAVVAVVLLLLVKCSALAALPSESRPWTILLVPCISRWAVLLVMARFPYVRREGLGTPFVPVGGSARVTIAGSAVTAAAVLALAGPLGLVLVGAAAVVALTVGAWATRLLGGVTGDIYGAVVETAEAVMLFAAVYLTIADPYALYPPLLAWM